MDENKSLNEMSNGFFENFMKQAKDFELDSAKLDKDSSTALHTLVNNSNEILICLREIKEILNNR